MAFEDCRGSNDLGHTCHRHFGRCRRCSQRHTFYIRFGRSGLGTFPQHTSVARCPCSTDPLRTECMLLPLSRICARPDRPCKWSGQVGSGTSRLDTGFARRRCPDTCAPRHSRCKFLGLRWRFGQRCRVCTWPGRSGLGTSRLGTGFAHRRCPDTCAPRHRRCKFLGLRWTFGQRCRVCTWSGRSRLGTCRLGTVFLRRPNTNGRLDTACMPCMYLGQHYLRATLPVDMRRSTAELRYHCCYPAHSRRTGGRTRTCRRRTVRSVRSIPSPLPTMCLVNTLNMSSRRPWKNIPEGKSRTSSGPLYLDRCRVGIPSLCGHRLSNSVRRGTQCMSHTRRAMSCQ